MGSAYDGGYFQKGKVKGVDLAYVDMIDLAQEMLSVLFPVESR